MNRAIPLIALTCAGCPQLDKLRDPSKPTPEQQAMVDAGMFGVMTEVSVTPPCVEEFRAVRCIDGVPSNWWSNEPL